MTEKKKQSTFFPTDEGKVSKTLGEKALLQALQKMLLIRNFELRAESAYQHGKVGGFFHAYMGQEAIQTAALAALGKNNWWITTYRCHALAILLDIHPDELMAELYGKQTGNAHGRGGSMHFYADRMLGGFGIVGGHIPIAFGAAFSLKYQQKKDEVAVCFLGDGAVAQGAFHESLNLGALWDLPCIVVIENNQWGMGTAVQRALCMDPIGETVAKAYEIEALTVNGMDFFNCYAGFAYAFEKVKKTSRPIIIEARTERFRGHSISDPALYRSKESLKEILKKDPIPFLFSKLKELKLASEEDYDRINQEQKQIVLDAMKFAEQSPDPDPLTLEEGVFAPQETSS